LCAALPTVTRFWMMTHGNRDRKNLFRFAGNIIHWKLPVPLRYSVPREG